MTVREEELVDIVRRTRRDDEAFEAALVELSNYIGPQVEWNR